MTYGNSGDTIASVKKFLEMATVLGRIMMRHAPKVSIKGLTKNVQLVQQAVLLVWALLNAWVVQGTMSLLRAILSASAFLVAEKAHIFRQYIPMKPVLLREVVGSPVPWRQPRPAILAQQIALTVSTMPEVKEASAMNAKTISFWTRILAPVFYPTVKMVSIDQTTKETKYKPAKNALLVAPLAPVIQYVIPVLRVMF